MAEARVNVLGVGISPIVMDDALERIQEWVSERRRTYVCVCTVHTVMECRRSAPVRAAVNRAALVTPDGMPLVWLARQAGFRNVTRVYGPDLLLAEIGASVRTGHRHFLYGGQAHVVEELAARLTGRFPGVNITGIYAPPIATVDELCTSEAADMINGAKPDIVWIGISTPKQELWMAQMRSRLNASVLIGVGAAFDFHSGRVRQAPNWIQQAGLEWLFRLAHEPRRLWRRYLFDNPRFILEVGQQKLGLKRFDIDSHSAGQRV